MVDRTKSNKKRNYLSPSAARPTAGYLKTFQSDGIELGYTPGDTNTVNNTIITELAKSGKRGAYH